MTLEQTESHMPHNPDASVEASAAYDTRTILFHWLTVVLVGGQWLGAHAIDWFPRGWPRTDMRSLHILFGALLAVLILARLAWRWGQGRKLPHADTGPLQWAATFVHGLLYALVISIVILGLLNAWVRGDNLFNLFSIPKLAVSKDVKAQIGDLHVLCANAILFVAGGHAAAALWHQYIRRDGVLGRMIPALQR